MPSGLEQIEVYNHVPFQITVIGGGELQKIDPQKSHTFLKSIAQLDIYDTPKTETLLDIIELKKYTVSWKAGHDLVVIITQPRWYARWRGKQVSYTIEWRANALPPATALGAIEEEQ
jgi:hypothetical protein